MNISINNIIINYKKEGNGKPIILLHGNGEDLSIFNELVDKLKSDFTTYAIDSRNHGESSTTNDFSYEAMASDIHGFIKKLNLKNVSLIGFSDGAIIGILLALQDENLFNKLVLMGPNLKPTDFKDDTRKWIEDEYKKAKDPLFELMLTQPNIEIESLKDIETPSLIIGGEHDIFDENLLPQIANKLPQGQLLIMKGHDHASYILNTDVIYPELISFLN